MKKLIQILGIVVLAIVVILNIVYTADMNSGEQISINFNSFIYIIGLIITAILIYFITEVINKHLYNGMNEEKKRKLLQMDGGNCYCFIFDFKCSMVNFRKTRNSSGFYTRFKFGTNILRE